MKNPKFPIQVKVGSAVVKIYHTPANGYDGYTVDSHFNGKRERFKRAALKDAKAKAEEIATKIANGQTAMIHLEAHEAEMLTRIKAKVEKTGKSVESVIEEYLEAKDALGGKASLAEAARFYFKKHHAAITPKTTTEIFDEMEMEKKRNGASKEYIQKLRHNLKRFKADFAGPLLSIDGNELNTWLGQMKFAARTRNDMRMSISVLVSFAKLRGYVPKDWSELERVAMARVVPGDITIFSPDELAKLLTAADQEKQLPFFLLGAFAGIRHAEIKRLTWGNVKWDSGYIEIPAAAAKRVRGASRRLIPIVPNLMEWLLPYHKHSGPICVLKKMSRPIADAASNAGITWKHNALRHSFISYRLAIVKSAAQVALEAGNSPKIIFSNYRELVTEAEANRWFSIVPGVGTVTNVSPEIAKASNS